MFEDLRGYDGIERLIFEWDTENVRANMGLRGYSKIVINGDIEGGGISHQSRVGLISTTQVENGPVHVLLSLSQRLDNRFVFKARGLKNE